MTKSLPLTQQDGCLLSSQIWELVVECLTNLSTTLFISKYKMCNVVRQMPESSSYELKQNTLKSFNTESLLWLWYRDRVYQCLNSGSENHHITEMTSHHFDFQTFICCQFAWYWQKIFFENDHISNHVYLISFFPMDIKLEKMKPNIINSHLYHKYYLSINKSTKHQWYGCKWCITAKAHYH